VPKLSASVLVEGVERHPLAINQSITLGLPLAVSPTLAGAICVNAGELVQPTIAAAAIFMRTLNPESERRSDKRVFKRVLPVS
jgi:hypothetical protein